MTLHTMLSELHYRDQIQEAVQKEINRLGDTVEVLADKTKRIRERISSFSCVIRFRLSV